MAIGPLLTSQSNTIGAQLELDRIRRDRERERLALIQQGMQGLLSAGQAGLGYLDRRAQEEQRGKEAEAGRRAELAKARLTHGNELERLREAARLRREEQEAGRLFDREQSEITRKDERGRALAESFAEMDKQKRLTAENQQKADALEDYRAAQINLEMARLERDDPTALQRAEADLMRAEAAVRNAATAEARLRLDERKAKRTTQPRPDKPKPKKALPASQVDAIAHNENIVSLYDEAIAKLRRGELNTGALPKWWNQKMQALGIDDPDTTAGFAGIDDLGDLRLRDRTGAAAPMEEQKNLARISGASNIDEDSLIKLLEQARSSAAGYNERLRRGLDVSYDVPPSSLPQEPAARPATPPPTPTEPAATDLVWMTDGNERLQFEPGEVEAMKEAGWSVFYPDKDVF